MKNRFLCIAVGVCAVGVLACGAPPPPPAAKPAPVEKGSDEPSFVVAGFGAMEEATVSKVLPYMTTGGGLPLEERCFARNKEDDQLWDTSNPDVIASIQANVLPIKAGILRWLEMGLAEGNEDAGINSWQVDIDELTIRHLAGEKVRLKKQQGCFTTDSMVLPAGSKIVTTMFGAKRIVVRSSKEMDRALVKKMKKRAKKQNIYINTVLTYKKARDDDGKVITNKRGRPMYMAPDGTLVGPKKVPPPKKRPVFELVIKVPGVLNFAYGYMPTSHWKMENTPAVCNLNLIYDDPTPRVPECPQLKNIGFGVTESRDVGTDIIVKAAADGEQVQQKVPFGEKSMIQVGGRYLVWVTPRKEELGAILEIDTIVLNGSNETEELPQFSFGK